MAKIKICGIKRIEDINAINQVLPDFIGFVFAESKRRISLNEAVILKKLLNPAVKTVGVFVNESVNTIIELCDLKVIDLVQLHGDENESYILELKNSIKNPIIKAIRVRSRQDIKAAEDLPCDYLLLDSYKDNAYGGTGKTFDWSLIPKISERKKPFFLAGGINRDNLSFALSAKPYCIDVSSGVETDGKKDPEKIKEIVNLLRKQN
ncbi:phosphoribosylanthranilate isomerase [Herbinix hemicellulosilytica]|uniref:N-(5'-phosphoribosyl)anthranilate isomerase n=1 Tax=Herbinix hemicellulosilytica TaxID=1564487 RepID=A0A0H5SFC2_HERHM|nr:phosphoribosylanthranilate isomerase [Herbinix hemicellulosilytica]RBP57507.1 phosphoribosylanthranilate isomerase [Herbinix hemicellulosilytica]CRZ33720.1 N-(5'-phosphoribosyl)anthranilate isomerase [Herbinix hemicellulosilytica]